MVRSLLEQMLHAGGRAKVIGNPSASHSSQPTANIQNLRIEVLVGRGLDRGEHRQDRFVGNVFGQMPVPMDSCVDKSPEGRQIAVAQPPHRRRISAPKSLHEFGVVQYAASPFNAALVCRTAEELSFEKQTSRGGLRR